jgi:ABC-type sugar transport system permease subunit
VNIAFFSGRRLRLWREYITAYLMIAPASILIFTFGIFPVGFALFVSMHKWRLKRGAFLGAENYIRALENLAYIAFFILAIGLVAWAVISLRRAYRQTQEFDDKPWALLFPAVLLALTFLSLVYWAFRVLPGALDIADKIIGVTKTRELFMQLLAEAFYLPQAYTPWLVFLALGLAVLIVLVVYTYVRMFANPRHLGYLFQFTGAVLGLIIGGWLLWVNFTLVKAAYSLALETGQDAGIWPQVITVASGVILLYAGWKVWQRGLAQANNISFFIHVLGAMTMLVGAWLLIGELPTLIASGDKDIWVGLKVTIFYSLGTVPFQLTFSLFLAILLFQKLWGSEVFRMLYFLPYVTPTVASAAIFRQLFSNRYQAPINQLLLNLGIAPQQWIREPRGIFTLLAEGLNIAWPEWAAGPSMALLVIMIYSIWTYIGYDTVIYLAGLGNISTELIEAAQIDGAGRWETFRHITLPLLSPTTYFLSLLAIIGTFKAFNHIWVMRQGLALGTTDTFSVVIFAEFFEKLRYGYASALAFVLFAVILSLTYINNKIQGARVFYG